MLHRGQGEARRMQNRHTPSLYPTDDQTNHSGVFPATKEIRWTSRTSFKNTHVALSIRVLVQEQCVFSHCLHVEARPGPMICHAMRVALDSQESCQPNASNQNLRGRFQRQTQATNTSNANPCDRCAESLPMRNKKPCDNVGDQVRQDREEHACFTEARVKHA